MEIYRFAFIILLSSLLVSCGEKKQETGNADKAAEKKTPAFTLPEVPVMLQSVEDRLHFVVNHYWDKFDFKDTAYIHAPDITEQAMANYIDLLTRVPQVMADSCVTRTLENVSLEPKMLNYFVETLRKYLFDPNSPMRNEEIFEPVCRFVASYASADEATQSRARYDLKLIDMNRVGSVAADFVYTLASGAQRRMHDLRSPYTLLLFYNPDCHGCAEVLAHMKSSPVLTDAGIMKQVSILAFYPDEEYKVWENHRDMIPSGWINGYDKELTVLDRELYDLKAMPTLYLLDKDKKVICKITDYVPNGLIPEADDCGDYIRLRIKHDGMIENWMEKPDFSDFVKDADAVKKIDTSIEEEPILDTKVEFTYSHLMAKLLRLPKYLQLEIGKALIANASEGFEEEDDEDSL